MISTRHVKEVARQAGADLVGVASMDRFEGAPPGMDPRYIFPDAQAAVVLGFRIPRGCFRGIEEGTYFAAYPAMGYAGINMVVAPLALRAVTLYLEDEGWEAVPIQNMVIDAGVDITTGEIKSGRKAVRPDLPAPDVMPHFRIAAVAAGLGEIGYSKLFLSPEFGPRQRLAMLLTDAPL
ncbi:MAG: (4Fe-4S)-binding protein, partial [Armatimonadetes bacterium]|nr:(4Fe-4S)-binding protein [Armatimonadota bacterium]